MSSSSSSTSSQQSNDINHKCNASTTTSPAATSNATTTNNTNWSIQASSGAMNTSNPIREIIETMNLSGNPNKKVIPLSIGDPTIFGNLKPCEQILDALKKANDSGKHYGYQTAAGMESAREAVAEYHFKCTGNKVKLQDVILASGCSHAIDLCICVLAKHGQHILIPRPGFPLYKTLTSVYGVQYKQYNLLADKNWSIDLEHLESLIDDNTAAIVINNPSNPCGSVFSRTHLMQILELAEKYRKPIIADEIYDKFVFSQKLYSRHLSSYSNNMISSSYPKQQQQQQQQTVFKQQQQQSHLNSISDVENRQPTKRASSSDDIDTSSVKNSEEDAFGGDSGRESGGDNIDDDDVDVENEHYNDNRQRKLVSLNGDQNITCEISYAPFISISSLSETVPILTCGGISKTCLIPGLRLGWIVINDKQNIFDASIRNGLNRLTQRLMGPNSLVQGALHDILNNVPENFYTDTMDLIFENALICYERLKLVKGLRPFMPQGSMYLMVRFDAKAFPDINGDLDFTSKLMNEESVLVLPGRCFDFPNYFRICLTVPTKVMKKAINRMAAFCERHYVKRITTNATLQTSSHPFNHSILANNPSNTITSPTSTTTTPNIKSNDAQKIKPNLSSPNISNGQQQQQVSKCKQ